MWNLLQDELGGGVWPRLLVALVDTGAKGLILMAAAGLAAAALRRNAAAARHLVWMLALCGLLILPVVSLMMPKWTLPILPAIEAPAVAPIAATPPIATAPAAPPVVSTPVAEIAPAVTNVIPPAERSERPPAPIGATPPESVQSPKNYGAWLLATWLTFTLLSLAPFAAGVVAVARMRRRAEVFSEGDLQALASTLGRCIGLKRPARLLRGPAGSMPMATGFIKPAVFLPDDALAWTKEKRRVVLLHELAHVKRRDCLTHAIARTATALHWFNPLAWLALRQLRIEREHACDDLVLAAGERPSAYAENLLEIARTLRAGTVVSAAAITMAQKSQLEGRLLAVLDAARERGRVTKSLIVTSTFSAIAVITLLAVIDVARSETNGAKFELKYAGGHIATVIGVSDGTVEKPEIAWGPDGALLPAVPESKGFSSWASLNVGKINRRFYLKIHRKAHDASDMDFGVKFRVNAKDGGESGANGGPRSAPVFTATFDKSMNQVGFDVGIASGPWQTVTQVTFWNASAGKVGEDLYSIVVTQPYYRDGQTCFSVTHSVENEDWRIVVFDKENTMHKLQSTGGIGIERMTQTEFVLGDIAPEEVERIELQVRDYEWQKFEGIALNPDDKDAATKASNNNVLEPNPGNDHQDSSVGVAGKSSETLPPPVNLAVHAYQQVGEPLAFKATVENWPHTTDEIPVILRCDGKEYDLGEKLELTATSSKIYVVNDPAPPRDGPQLNVGKHRASLIFRNVAVHPKPNGEAESSTTLATFDKIESNEVEFEVVNAIPAGYFKPKSNDEWEMILRNMFRSVGYKVSDGGAHHLVVKWWERLPFNLAFNVAIEEAGSNKIHLLGNMSIPGTAEQTGGDDGGEPTWSIINPATKKILPSLAGKQVRLILTPSIDAAMSDPSIVTYYGRSFTTPWMVLLPDLTPELEQNNGQSSSHNELPAEAVHETEKAVDAAEVPADFPPSTLEIHEQPLGSGRPVKYPFLAEDGKIDRVQGIPKTDISWKYRGKDKEGWHFTFTRMSQIEEGKPPQTIQRDFTFQPDPYGNHMVFAHDGVWIGVVETNRVRSIPAALPVRLSAQHHYAIGDPIYIEVAPGDYPHGVQVGFCIIRCDGKEYKQNITPNAPFPRLFRLDPAPYAPWNLMGKHRLSAVLNLLPYPPITGDANPVEFTNFEEVESNEIEFAIVLAIPEDFVQPALDKAWNENTAPKLAENSLPRLKDPLDTNMYWGEENRGLQAALRFLPEKVAYASGEPVGVEVLVRNSSPKTIEFVTSKWRQDDQWTVLDATDKKLEPEQKQYSAPRGFLRVRLDPGQSVTLECASMALFSKGDSTNIEYPVATRFTTDVGIHSVQLDLNLPGGYSDKGPGVPKPDDWTGTLTTGKRILNLVEQPTPDAVADGPDAVNLFIDPRQALESSNPQPVVPAFLDPFAPNPRDKFLRTPGANAVWGEVQNGLQSALQFTQEEPVFELGKAIPFEFLVRNVSDAPVQLVIREHLQYGAPKVFDGSGNSLLAGSISNTAWPSLVRIQLDPGQCVGLPGEGLAFLPKGVNAASNLDYYVGTYVETQAGTHSVQFTFALPGETMPDGVGTPQSGDWTGKLTTGKRVLNLVEQPTPDAEADGPDAKELADEPAVWGEPSNGLQAAIYIDPRDGGYPMDEPIGVSILLRNAGKEIIEFSNIGFLVPQAITVHDAAGNIRSGGKFMNFEGSFSVPRFQIAPGQVVQLDHPDITFVKGPIANPDRFPQTAIAVEPGIHSIQIQTIIPPPLTFPGAPGVSRSQADDWTGPLTTGKTELLILPGVTPPGLQVRWVAADWGSGLVTRVPWRDGNQPEGEPAELELLDTVLWRDADIAALEVVPGPVSGQFAVRLQLRGEAIVRWANATRGNAGKRLALVLDGKVIHAFTLLDTMAGGEMMLTGDFNRDEADSLTNAIRAANPLIADTLRVAGSATSTLGREVEISEADAVSQAIPAEDAADVSSANSNDSLYSVFNHDYFGALLELYLPTHIAGDAITPPAANTSWGPVVNGLQAAVRFTPEKAEYVLGERIAMEFLVRNTGPIPLEIVTGKLRTGDQCYVTDEQGTKRSTGTSHDENVFTPYRRLRLAPEEVVAIENAGFTILPENASTSSDYPTGSWAKSKPGAHTVKFMLIFPQDSTRLGEGAFRPAVWTGGLMTGGRNLNIVAPEVPAGEELAQEADVRSNLESAVRAILAEMQDDEEGYLVTVAASQRERLRALLPDAADFLLALASDDREEARADRRKAASILSELWTEIPREKLEKFFATAGRTYVRSRPVYPQGVAASIATGYNFSECVGLWERGDGLVLKTTTQCTVDGRLVGEPFEYTGAGGGSRWIETKSLSPGTHTAQVSTDYEITHHGLTFAGTLHSEPVMIEIGAPSLADELAAPASQELEQEVRHALKISSFESMSFDGDSPSGDQPNVIFLGPVGAGTRLHLPNWKLTEALPVDLCFDVSFQVEESGEIFAGYPLIVLKNTIGEAYLSPLDLRAFAAGRTDAVPVRILLTPSRALALTDLNVTQYYNGTTITSDVVEAFVDPPTETVDSNDLTLGPEVEVTIRHSGENSMTDFDTGKLFTPPSFNGTEDAFAWCAKSGIDAGGGNQPEVRGLIGMDLVLNPEANTIWEAAETNGALKHDAFKYGKPGNPVYLSAKGELPATWTFKTREGGLGIVQILGFEDEEPRGVKIRYRMLGKGSE